MSGNSFPLFNTPDSADSEVHITPLSDIQQQVVMLIASGKSVREIAHKTGLSEGTVNRWKQQPEIASAVNEILRSNHKVFKERLQNLAIKAIEVLEAVIDDPDAPLQDKTYAAVKVLEISGLADSDRVSESKLSVNPKPDKESISETSLNSYPLEQILAEY